MKSLGALLSRELSERWRALPVSLLLGFVPFVLPLASHPAPGETSNLHAVAAVLAAAVSGVLAFVLGSSTLAGDLAERRLDFYYALPLPGWVIWAGKLGAAFILCLASGLLTFLPSWFTDNQDGGAFLASLGGFSLPGVLLLWVGAVALLLLTAHSLSVIARARSAWIALDLVGVALVGVVGWWSASTLGEWSADRALERLALGGAAALLLVLAGASAAQTLVGRTDLRRGHRALSIALWGSLLLAAGAGAAYATWYVHPSPNDLSEADEVIGDSQGRLALLAGGLGSRDGMGAAFIVQRAPYRWWHPHLLEPTRAVSPDLSFAADSRSAVWLERLGARQLGPVQLDLHTGRTTSVTIPELLPGAPFALSPDGQELAGVSGSRLIVSRLPNGPLVAAASLHGLASVRELRFLDPKHLRLTSVRVSQNETETTVSDLEIPSGALQTRAQIRGLAFYPLSLSPQGDRLLGRPHVIHDRSYQLYSAGTGERLAVLVAPPGAHLLSVDYLGDGRLVASIGSAAGQTFQLLDRDGAALSGARPVVLPAAERFITCAEPAPGLLVVASVPADGNVADFLLVDLQAGTFRQIARGQPPSPSVSLYVRELPRWALVRTAQGWSTIDPVRGPLPLVTP